VTFSSEPPTAEPAVVSPDKPIGRPEDDLLGRENFVALVAEQVLTPRPADAFVLAITGAWGSGKTSVLKLIETELGDSVHVVKFNPWFYSGADELMVRFFADLYSGLAAHLPGARKKRLSESIKKYADVLTPLRGVGGVAAKAAERLVGRDVHQERKAVAAALAELDKRVLLVLDDLDRLAPAEVADVVRLVKLVGDFPNVTYLLAYDRNQVEQALTRAHGSDGRLYLDKIVQASYPVPHVESTELARMLSESLRGTLGPAMDGLPAGRWATVLNAIIRPLLGTVRDVRRINNVAPATVRSTEDDIAVADVLALEALRLLLPSFHEQLMPLATALTRPPRGEMFADREERDAQLVRDLVADSGNPAVAEAAIRHLFPMALRHVTGLASDRSDMLRWRRERRVALQAHLMTYLTKALGVHAVRAAKVGAALDALGDADAFEQELEDMREGALSDLLARMLDHVERVPSGTSMTAVAVANLFNVIPRLPVQTRTWLDIEPERLVVPLTSALLVRLPADERATAAEEAFERINSMYGRFRLVQWFGVGTQPDHEGDDPLLDMPTTRRLRRRVLDTLLEAPPSVFTQERQFGRLVSVLVFDGEEEGKARLAELAQDDEFMVRLLTAFSAHQVEADVDGEEIARGGITVEWDSLVRALGRDLLVRRVRELVVGARGEELSADMRAILELAATQLGTPRPAE
jgi:hypothetical protein